MTQQDQKKNLDPSKTMFRKFTNMKSFSQLITKNREIQKCTTEFMYIKTKPLNQKSEHFLSRLY